MISVLVAYWLMYPFIEGCDAPYYAIAARDLATATPGSETARQYFPGVYWFWRLIAPWKWPHPPQIVNISEALLCLLCAFTATLVGRSLKLSPLYQICAFWAVSACLINFEGLTEVSEQLILVFFFLSLSLLPRMVVSSGAAYEVGLGFLLALCLSIKQQSVFVVAPFFLGLLIHFGVSSRSLLRTLLSTARIGASLATFFLMFLYISGYRVTDLFGGARYAAGYGSMCAGLSCLMSAVSDYLWLFIVPFCYLIRCWVRRDLNHQSAIVLITTGAGFMSCCQFLFRPYGHYGMLVAAPLIPAGAQRDFSLSSRVPPAPCMDTSIRALNSRRFTVESSQELGADLAVDSAGLYQLSPLYFRAMQLPAQERTCARAAADVLSNSLKLRHHPGFTWSWLSHVYRRAEIRGNRSLEAIQNNCCLRTL